MYIGEDWLSPFSWDIGKIKIRGVDNVGLTGITVLNKPILYPWNYGIIYHLSGNAIKPSHISRFVRDLEY